MKCVVALGILALVVVLTGKSLDCEQVPVQAVYEKKYLARPALLALLALFYLSQIFHWRARLAG